MSDLYSKASLVMNPQLVDTGKVYSIKPEDRKGDFTFTRSSAATRVNADGFIEKETQNLLTYSNDFSQWSNAGSTITSGQSGYDGSSDAWLLESINTGQSSVIQSISKSGVQTASVYAKAGTANWMFIYSVAAPDKSAWFNLGNGTLGDKYGIDSSIESVGNGWYRCSVSYNATISSIRIYVSDGNFNVSSALGANIYIQDAQLEQGLVARDYIETTTTAVEGGITDNVPRLDYTDSSCPALLLEPQRTNLLGQSECINSSGGWSFSGGLTTEVNSIDSPEGLTNGTKVVIGSNQYGELRGPTISQSATTYTLSLFAKAGDLDWCIVQYDDTSSNYVRVWFNISTGAVGSNAQVGWSIVGTPTIESAGTDGWYRCNIVLTTTATSTNRVTMFGAIGDGAFGATENSYFYTYGFQVEEGSYPTSYIPTYGSSVTRIMENCGDISLATLSNNYSIFAEVTRIASDEINNLEFIDYRSSGNDRLRIYTYNTGAIRFRAYFNDGTNNSYFTNDNDWNQGDTIKFCWTYNNGDIVIYANGQQLHSVSQTLNNLNYLNIETQKIKQLLHFDTTLTSSEAIALTTL